MGKLTIAKIGSLSRPGRHGDGGTRDIGLGGWPLVSLREAREKAFAYRKLA